MKLPELPPSLRRPLPWWLVCLLVALLTIPPTGRLLRKVQTGWNAPPNPSWIGVEPGKAKAGEQVYDVDTRLIHGGLVKVETFRDTLRWWHGTWAGQVPFYRPLTSYVFWFQWKAWGVQEHRYALVAILLHLAALLLFLRMAYLLFRHFNLPRPDVGAILTCLAFTLSSPLLEGQEEVVSEIYDKWKNEPDALTLAFLSLSLIMYLRPQTTPAPNRPLRSLGVRAGATIFYLLTCLTKEAGIFLPLLLPLIESDALRQGGESRRAALRRMAPLFVVLVIYLILRSIFLGQLVGFQYGSNGAWVYRMAHSLLGRFSNAVVHLQWAELSLTGAILALGVISIRFRHRLLIVMGAVAFLLVALGSIGAVQVHEATGVPWDIASGLLLLLGEPNRSHALTSVTLLLLTISAFRLRPWFAATTYGWALLALGMTLFSPSVLHRFYLIHAGFVLLWVGGGLLLAERLWQYLPLLRKPPQAPQSLSVPHPAPTTPANP